MTYLSIDLDYWLATGADNLVPLTKLFWMLRQVKTDNWVVVDEHHHILDHLNDTNPSDILHVDYHTDVAFETEWNRRTRKKLELNCGTFFWFVKNRQTMRYTWFYPEADCPRYAGLCMDPGEKPLAHKNWIFQEQRRRLGLPTRKQLQRVQAVGFAISHDYCLANSDYVRRLMAVLRRRYIPPTAQWLLDTQLKDLPNAYAGTSGLQESPALLAA